MSERKTQQDPAAGLPGPWKVEAVGGEAVPEGTESTVTFSDDRVEGHGGVNQFAGSWHVEGDLVELGPFRSTRMAGPVAAMRQESRLLGALAGSHPFRVSGDVAVVGQGADEVRLRRLSSDPGTDAEPVPGRSRRP